MSSRVLVLSTLAGLALTLAAGCSSEKDLVQRGDLKVESYSTPQWSLANPSVVQEGGIMEVRGQATRGDAPEKAGDPRRHDYVGVWIIEPSGEMKHNFVLALTEHGEYSYRYLYRPPAGSTIVVAQIPDNPEMLNFTGPAAGSPSLGLADYGAPGGPVWVQSNVARWSQSRQSYYDQTVGQLGGMGSQSPGYRAGDVGVGGLRRAGGGPPSAVPAGASMR